LFCKISKRKTGRIIVANTELTFQNKEKEKRCRISCCQYRTSLQKKRKSAAELIIANKELLTK
jgi:hypothetical protein